MPSVEHTALVEAPMEVVWKYLEKMSNWAPYLEGYQKHEEINDKESIWTLKGDMGVLARVVQMELTRVGQLLERTHGQHYQVGPEIPLALVMREGGTADARTVKARAEAFLKEEVFKACQLFVYERVDAALGAIDQLSVEIDEALTRPGHADGRRDQQVAQPLLEQEDRVVEQPLHGLGCDHHVDCRARAGFQRTAQPGERGAVALSCPRLVRRGPVGDVTLFVAVDAEANG